MDEKGHPISTYVKVAKDANKLVEEFMLLANRSVAQMIAVVPRGRKPKVFVYRIHDVPDPEKWRSSVALWHALAIKYAPRAPKPR